MEARIAMCIMVGAAIAAGIILNATRAAGWCAALVLWSGGFAAAWTGPESLYAAEHLLVWAVMGPPACLAFCYVARRISWRLVKRHPPGRFAPSPRQRPARRPMIRL